ncbi:bifunctional protein-disulfide isomerase/oxidoreductase DsbC [Endothiovibrio diazotrophicus]
MQSSNPLLLAALLGAAVVASLPVAAEEDRHEANIRTALARVLPNVAVDGVAPSPIAGLYTVTAGSRIFYMSGDGANLIRGDFFDLKSHRNLTDEHITKVRKKALDDLDEKQMVVYSPEKPKHTITVFTDIDCPYCRKLHHEMADYNAAGIEVRYLFYPRAGVGSPSYDKAVSVWCADDRNAALDKAKNGEEIEAKKCDNPIADQMALGDVFGVRGTPAIVLESGQVLPGYIPPARLAAMLDDKTDNVAAN